VIKSAFQAGVPANTNPRSLDSGFPRLKKRAGALPRSG
jgi:hypothetical protein